MPRDRGLLAREARGVQEIGELACRGVFVVIDHNERDRDFAESLVEASDDGGLPAGFVGEEAQFMGAASQEIAQMRAQLKTIKDPELQAYVDRIGRRLWDDTCIRLRVSERGLELEHARDACAIGKDRAHRIGREQGIGHGAGWFIGVWSKARFQTRSMMSAMPCPTPMHIVARP